MKKFEEVLNNVGDDEIFADFVGQVFLMDPDFFLGKFAKTYNNKINSLFRIKDLFEMEGYILKKLSLYQDERIIVSFTGEIARGDGKMVGRIYLTNYRIIVQGVFKSKGVPLLNTSFAGKAIAKRIYKKLVKKLQSMMNQITIAELPCFGYQYPIFGLQKIRLENSGVKIVYSIRIKTENPNGMVSSKRYTFNIVVSRYPRESNVEFNIRAREITSILNNTIVETSKQFE